MDALKTKVADLARILREIGRLTVSFSGGVDSSYLLAACIDVLGPEGVLALTADSPLMPRSDLAAAQLVAGGLGVRHRIVHADELSNAAVSANSPDRCYHCKLNRFRVLLEIARSEGFVHLVHGENMDDALDYRPGSTAAEELGVRAPLREAGLTKSEVRRLAASRGLPNWDRPADACLASRIPYGTPLTRQALGRVEAAEEALRRISGVRQLRVRDHYPLARIEVSAAEIARLALPDCRTALVESLRSLSYRYVTLDLDGYRMGSLNDALEPGLGR